MIGSLTAGARAGSGAAARGGAIPLRLPEAEPCGTGAVRRYP
jgi:hypothetical protein